ncbi:MAG: PH domain-containing protein [Microbacterium sp.]|nr:PH domain-containing protein [Microbacterium sp.]MCX6500842.1 PH domain-containing protein [Microbacterium sp.]
MPGVLDADTYDRFVEPRSPQRLEVTGGEWHRVSRRYLTVQLITSGTLLALVLIAVTVLTLVFGQLWPLIPGGVLTIMLGVTLAVLPRQVRAIGYQLRADDLVLRRGILWQRIVAVPYGRMQLIDVTHGPLDRGFRIAQLRLVTAAAASAVTIPGLDQAAAEALRDRLVEVAENRRTGL